MRNEMQCEVEKLQEDMRRLEMKMAALSNADNENIIRMVETGEPPHPATGKCQRCKDCSHIRLPHRTTPRYTCDARQATIEPKWTCELYNEKSSNH